MKTTSTISVAALVGVGLLSSGCFLFETHDSAVVEGDDVRLEVPGDAGFRAAGEEGEVYTVIGETAAEVNGWVVEVVENVATVIRFLDGQRETRRDGNWRVYGPFDDDEGRDLAWLIKVQGDAEATDYEVYVGDAGSGSESDMALVMHGGVQVDGDLRTGDFTLDFDAIEQHPEVKDLEEAGTTFSGAIEVSFERDVSNEKKVIEIQFIGFEEQSFLGEAWRSDETYAYRRDREGNGSFHLAVEGVWDDNAFGGIHTNRVQLDAVWDDAEHGRAQAQILEVENESSGLSSGDFVVDECWDSMGNLTFRDLNAPYDAQYPEYLRGEESACTFGVGDLPRG